MASEQSLIIALGFLLATFAIGWVVYALWQWASRQREL